MRCAHCGAEIGEHELYCPFCGRALPTDELSEAERLLVQKNVAYYGRHFAALRAGKRADWNWAAFLAFPFWAAYRKMVLPALLSFIAFGALFWFRAGWLAPALMTAFGLLGNRAYYRRTQAMADGLAEEPPERLEQTCLKRGGVTPLLPALLAAALLLLGVWWQVFLQRAALLLYPRG